MYTAEAKIFILDKKEYPQIENLLFQVRSFIHWSIA